MMTIANQRELLNWYFNTDLYNRLETGVVYNEWQRYSERIMHAQTVRLAA